jgi:hypothetical protein
MEVGMEIEEALYCASYSYTSENSRRGGKVTFFLVSRKLV